LCDLPDLEDLSLALSGNRREVSLAMFKAQMIVVSTNATMYCGRLGDNFAEELESYKSAEMKVKDNKPVEL